MPIAKSTIWTDTWNVIFNLIKDNVADPLGRSKWIYSAFPEFRIESKDNYPIIVIPPLPGIEDQFTMEKGKFTFECPIEIYSSKAFEVDSLSNDVFKAFNIKRYITLRSGNGLMLTRLLGRTYDMFLRGGIKIHNSTLRFECQWIYTRGA